MKHPDFSEPDPVDYSNPPSRSRYYTQAERDLLEYLDGFDDLQPFTRTTTYPWDGE